MQVKEIMTTDAQSCTPDANLATAAELMWERDCGVLPVVEDGRGVVGVITDRDICMAATMKQRPLADIPVSEVVTGQLFSCAPEEDVRDALKIMQQQRIRRLPVIDAAGQLCGILSMNDVALSAQETKQDAKVSYRDVVETYKAICAHRDLPQPAAQIEAQPHRQLAATA